MLYQYIILAVLLFAILWTPIAGLGVGFQQHQLRSDFIKGHFDITEKQRKRF